VSTRKIHRRFIGVGYDGDRNVKDEERLVVTDTERPPANDQEDLQKSSVVPRWVFITALVIFAGVIIYGYLARPGWVGVSGKKFWDYLELLIVPAALAIGVYLLNRAQERERQAQEAYREHEREATEAARREREREAQAAQRERELEVENRRAQDAALQAYLDQMSQLLNDQGLRSRTHWLDEARVTARARSLAVLRRLDAERKKSALQFLYEAQLINRCKNGPLVGLSGADLTSTDLRYITLRNAALDGAQLENADLGEAKLSDINLGGANLRGADLSDADLRDAHLENADLRKAKLNGVDLGGADLSGADLSNAKLRSANLANADLQRKDDERKLNGANLSGAELTETNLSGADLSGANLTDAYELIKEGSKRENTRRVTNEQLEAQHTKSLASATMPDGQKYEDWLKSQGRGEDGETSSPS
jgi:uncharacterized protein YjbI with pentapeptide repeats